MKRYNKIIWALYIAIVIYNIYVIYLYLSFKEITNFTRLFVPLSAVFVVISVGYTVNKTKDKRTKTKKQTTKCKQCNDKRDYAHPTEDEVYEYCGIIEDITEQATDINHIYLCPKEVIIDLVESETICKNYKQRQ